MDIVPVFIVQTTSGAVAFRHEHEAQAFAPGVKITRASGILGKKEVRLVADPIPFYFTAVEAKGLVAAATAALKGRSPE